MKRLIFLLAISLCGLSVYAQKTNSQLEAHLNQYEVNFKELMAYRGINYYAGQVTREKVIKAVQRYSLDESGNPVKEFAFLFYHHQQDTLHAWVIDYTGILADSHSPVTIDSMLNLESTLKFSMSIDKMIGTTDRAKKDLKSSKRYRLKTPESIELLSRIAFPEKITAALAGKKYLLVMPAVNLSTIPFSMVKPWPDSKGTLLDSMAFCFAHNFQQLFAEVEKMDETYPEMMGLLKNPVIVGNPLFTDTCTDGLAPLPGAEQEAKKVGELLNTEPLIGASATKIKVIYKMRASSFIYLATHGWSDTEDPLRNSFIALNGKDSCGYLTPFEIQSMKLINKPVVILSACQSGLGKVMEAGIVGVARGFLKAGSRSVTMSLWNVDDAETAELMTEFVAQMQKPHVFFPAEPWRQAVLEYRKRKKKDEPLNWAAFQTFGVPYGPAFPVSLHR
jgi:CHAT domain-containing protein